MQPTVAWPGERKQQNTEVLHAKPVNSWCFLSTAGCSKGDRHCGLVSSWPFLPEPGKPGIKPAAAAPLNICVKSSLGTAAAPPGGSTYPLGRPTFTCRPHKSTLSSCMPAVASSSVRHSTKPKRPADTEMLSSTYTMYYDFHHEHHYLQTSTIKIGCQLGMAPCMLICVCFNRLNPAMFCQRCDCKSGISNSQLTSLHPCCPMTLS